MADTSRQSRLLSLPTELIELIVCRLDSPALFATVLTNKQLMTIAGPLILRHITIYHQFWNGPHFGPLLWDDKNESSEKKENSSTNRQQSLVKMATEYPEKASSVISYTERILSWEEYPIFPPNREAPRPSHVVTSLTNIQHLTLIAPVAFFWNWISDLRPPFFDQRHELPHLKTLHLEYWNYGRMRPSIPRGLSGIIPQPNLEDITLCNLDLPIFWPQPSSPPSISNMPLKVLRFVDCDIAPKFLAYLLSATNCIETLEISTRWCRRNLPRLKDGAFFIQEWAAAMSSAKHTLKTLNLPNLYTSHFAHKTGVPQRISLDLFAAAETLTINIKQVLEKRKELEKRKDNKQIFPPNLKSLKFFSWDNYYHSPDRHQLRRLAHILENEKSLKSLRSIEIYTADTDVSLNYICSRLVAICRKRNIELTTLQRDDATSCDCRYCPHRFQILYGGFTTIGP